MKIWALVIVCVGLCQATPVPVQNATDPEYYSQVPGDNSHYVEGVSRYIWMPDGEGVPHLVDLKMEPSAEEMARLERNGANNQYWLFTRSNRHNRQVLVHNNLDSVRNSNYNGNRPLKVIVHGWRSSGTSPINPRLTAAFLDSTDCNVIVVDWNRLAGNVVYNYAARGVPDVGRHIGNFVNWLFANRGGNWNNVHFVGFSLGAHAVGNAGRTVGNRAARVTGLDPAGPTWGGNGNALRASDGQYVECIHTDGGLLGIMDAICRANFYPNGGRNPQPGCRYSSCSHSRAYELMEATIRHNNLVGRNCGSLRDAERMNCSGHQFHMGNAQLGKRGSGFFAMATRDRFPF